MVPDPGSATVVTLLQRGDLWALQGFTREPSHYAIVLFIFALLIILLISIGAKKHHDITWLFATVILMYLTAATSAVVFYILLMIFGIIALTNEKSVSKTNIRLLLGISCCFVLVVVIALISFGVFNSTTQFQKMIGLFNNLPNLLSGNIGELLNVQGSGRLVSIIDSFSVFLDRPLIGIGTGEINPYSGFIALLAGSGLFGALLLVLFLLRIDGNYCDFKNNILALVLFIGSTFILMDLSAMYATYWLILVPLVKQAFQKAEVPKVEKGLSSNLS